MFSLTKCPMKFYTWRKKIRFSKQGSFFFSHQYSFCPKVIISLVILRIDTWKKSLLTLRLIKLIFSFKLHSFMLWWTNFQTEKEGRAAIVAHTNLKSNSAHLKEHQYLLQKSFFIAFISVFKGLGPANTCLGQFFYFFLYIFSRIIFHYCIQQQF